MAETHPEQWIEAHGDVLYGFAIARVRNTAVAEDLVQETLLAAWRGRERYTGRSAERTWLVGILKHKIIDHFRRQERQPGPPGDEAGSDTDFLTDGHWNVEGGRAPRSWSDPHRSFDRAEFWEVFERCRDALPERAARIFVLRELDDMPGEEICKQLGLSATNLWVTLHRARTQLRRCLEKNWFAL